MKLVNRKLLVINLKFLISLFRSVLIDRITVIQEKIIWYKYYSVIPTKERLVVIEQ